MKKTNRKLPIRSLTIRPLTALPKVTGGATVDGEAVLPPPSNGCTLGCSRFVCG